MYLSRNCRFKKLGLNVILPFFIYLVYKDTNKLSFSSNFDFGWNVGFLSSVKYALSLIVNLFFNLFQTNIFYWLTFIYILKWDKYTIYVKVFYTSFNDLLPHHLISLKHILVALNKWCDEHLTIYMCKIFWIWFLFYTNSRISQLIMCMNLKII